MQPTMSLFTAMVATIGAASAQYAASAPAVSTTPAMSTAPAMSTITVLPGCPSAAPANVLVTRSAVVVPSCAGNETKPTLVTMPGYATNATATGTGGTPMFTGAAGRVNGAGAMAVLAGGVFVAMLI